MRSNSVKIKNVDEWQALSILDPSSALGREGEQLMIGRNDQYGTVLASKKKGSTNEDDKVTAAKNTLSK